MSSQTQDPLSSLDTIVREIIRPSAQEIDAQGAFPARNIEALGKAGLLGAVSAREVGGLAGGMRLASRVVSRIASDCGSTAMVATMHYSGCAVLERYASPEVRKQAAAGKHLSTLAFSEATSRSQFWAPTSTAAKAKNGVRLDARKSWVTSARHATAYVWSSKPLLGSGSGASTIWLVPNGAPGLAVQGSYDGLGLRGNDSSAVVAEGVIVPESAMLGGDGAGFEIMMQVVLPIFQVLSASVSIGLMEGAVERTIAHTQNTRFEHTGEALRDLPVVRANVARMRVQTDMAKALLEDTLAALEAGRPDAMLRVLECKAAAGDVSIAVLDTAMRVCGGAAFRKEGGLERLFRDARAASIMAPTSDALNDFIGKAVTGLDLF
jgi:alkylation response protein AidB-like acyl-CoA dehydrogenase